MRPLAVLVVLIASGCHAPAAPTDAPPAAPAASAVPAPTETHAHTLAASSTAPTLSATPAPEAAPTTSPPPSTADPVRAATTPTRDALVQRAAAVANAALDRAYARSTPMMSPHVGPWVKAEDARVEGDADRGLRVVWSRHPPAGFAFDAEVFVPAKGEPRVVRASASFSPD